MRPHSLARALTYSAGAVAAAAGLHSALAGVRSVPGRPRAGTEVDSELRYYGAFYSAYGLALLRVAPRAEEETVALRSLAGVMFAGGLARARGWAANGRPHPVQLALLTLELGVPPVLVAAQSRAATVG